ncbi:craniofacial development protein 2-like [Elysia marginata]|uniref:Craniofacial development protein 2-like n=1 Tax=Elysia marginata TaxID=1093978 RepID=A0AAV4JNS5_9GAST|nr:craniofacial development protein 2-like [Elysia marginata]
MYTKNGVAIMLSKRAEAALIDWAPINERIISARFYSKHIKLTLKHAYAPTNDAEIDIKTEFYEMLDETVRKSHRHDILIVTGDFNANVGTYPNHYDSVMGKHGEGERNENSETLCEFCAMNDLLITGTLFPHKKIHKFIWVSPDGKTKNQIDHALINKKFRTSVRDTRVQRGADVSSDHYLVKTSLKLKLKRPPNTEKSRLRYDVDKLKNKNIREEFCLKLHNRFKLLESVDNDQNTDTIETLSSNLEIAYTDAAKDVFGFRRNKTKPWISQESWTRIHERKEIYKKLIRTKSERLKQRHRDDYKQKDKDVKKQLK